MNLLEVFITLFELLIISLIYTKEIPAITSFPINQKQIQYLSNKIKELSQIQEENEKQKLIIRDKTQELSRLQDENDELRMKNKRLQKEN